MSRRPRRTPEAIDERSSARALRAVATFEAVKGTVVLLLALGLLHWLHKDVGDAVESLLAHLHISSEHRIGHSILHSASKMDDAWLCTHWRVTWAALKPCLAWRGFQHRRA